VPADDQVTSLSAIGGNAHHGRVAFTTTHWSVVLTAQGESAAAQEALESSAARTGDLFMASCGDRVFGQRRRRISPKVFLRCYWSGEI
jgi:hypothetical protein